MSYFASFPRINYEYKSKVSKQSVDILRRYKVIQRILNTNSYETLNISEYETPQSLANKFYGDRNLYWVVLLFNEIINPLYEWPLSGSKLIKRLDSMYPGISLFITENQTTDLSSVVINTKGANSSFSIGENVFIYDSSDELIDDGSIYEYDRTTGHMKISGVDSFVLEENYYLQDSSGSKKVYIGRKFDDVKLSLKYFASNKKYLNPYYVIGETKVIDAYVNGSNLESFDITSVSILDHETYENDDRRRIKIPDISVVRLLENKLRELNRT